MYHRVWQRSSPNSPVQRGGAKGGGRAAHTDREHLPDRGPHRSSTPIPFIGTCPSALDGRASTGEACGPSRAPGPTTPAPPPPHERPSSCLPSPSPTNQHGRTLDTGPIQPPATRPSSSPHRPATRSACAQGGARDQGVTLPEPRKACTVGPPSLPYHSKYSQRPCHLRAGSGALQPPPPICRFGVTAHAPPPLLLPSQPLPAEPMRQATRDGSYIHPCHRLFLIPLHAPPQGACVHTGPRDQGVTLPDPGKAWTVGPPSLPYHSKYPQRPCHLRAGSGALQPCPRPIPPRHAPHPGTPSAPPTRAVPRGRAHAGAHGAQAS